MLVPHKASKNTLFAVVDVKTNRCKYRHLINGMDATILNTYLIPKFTLLKYEMLKKLVTYIKILLKVFREPNDSPQPWLGNTGIM